MIALVTGGAASGKSAYAESLAQQLAASVPTAPEGADHRKQALVYLATMQPFGEEGARRIARHRALRAGKGFSTVEVPRNVGGVDVAPAQTVLLEDLGNLVANELFAPHADSAPAANPAEAVRATVCASVLSLANRCTHLVIVANEVGADGVTYPAETRAYQEVLGACACALAAQADLAVEVAAGIPCVLKGALPTPAASPDAPTVAPDAKQVPR